MLDNKFSIDGDHVMLTNYPINPRIRAYGKARIDLAMRLNNSADWDEYWKPPSNSFPLTWGESWKHCVEYRVDDFAAEVGFFIDVLGFSVNALDHSYAMFTSPQQDFFFSFVPAQANEAPTSPDAFRLQFMVRDVSATYQELLARGIAFELTPQPLCPASSIQITSFRTPNGIPVEIWGIAMENSNPLPEMNFSQNLQALINSNQNDQAGDEDEDAEELDGEYEDDEVDDDGYLEGEEQGNDDDVDVEEDDDLDEDSDGHKDIDTPDEEDEEEDDDDEADLDEEDGDDEYDEDEYDEEEDDDDEDDENDYEIDDDDEDDDYDKDEYSSSIDHDLKKGHELNPFPEAKALKSNTFLKPGSQHTRLLEYVDLESA